MSGLGAGFLLNTGSNLAAQHSWYVPKLEEKLCHAIGKHKIWGWVANPTLMPEGSRKKNSGWDDHVFSYKRKQ